MQLSEEAQNAVASSILHKPYIIQVHAKMLDAATCVLDIRTMWEAGSVVVNMDAPRGEEVVNDGP